MVRSGARGDRARWHDEPAVVRSKQNTAGGLGAVSSYPWIRNCPLTLQPARAQRADFEWYLEHPEEGRVASNETDTAGRSTCVERRKLQGVMVTCCCREWPYGLQAISCGAMQQLEWFVRILRSPLGGAPSCLWNDFEARTPGVRAGYSRAVTVEVAAASFSGSWHLRMGRDLFTFREAVLNSTRANHLTANR